MSFANNDHIVLRSGESLTRRFRFEPCSGPLTNDGALPYGTLIASVVLTEYVRDGIGWTAVDDGTLVVSSSNGTNDVYVKLQHPSSVGYYKIVFTATLSNGEILVDEFKNIRSV
jgi:hypothetical protein